MEPLDPRIAPAPGVSHSRPRTTFRALGLAAASLVMLVLGACRGPTVTAKVVEGPSSLIVMVDAMDPRVLGPGIDGANAELRLRSGNMGDKQLGSAPSEKNGELEFPAENVHIGDKLMLSVTKEGYFPARGEVSVTPEDKRYLVVMKRSGQ